MEQHKNVPAIRFKGFQEEWKSSKLNEFSLYKSSNISASIAKEKGNYPLFDANRCIGYVNDYLLKNDYISIIKDGSGVGRVRILKGKSSFIATMGAISNLGSDLDFLYNILIKTDFNKHITGATIPHIYYSVYGNEEYKIPNFSEQTQIGNFFKNIDEQINLQEQKHQKLVNLKKAMLEKMFPKEGINVPEIRFKGFTEEWESFYIKDICSISTGKSNTQDKVDNGNYSFYVRSATIEKSNRFLYDEEAVLTVGDGVGTGKVFHYVNGKYDLHQRVYRMFNFNGIEGKFFYYIFSKEFYKRVMGMTAKTSVDSVRLDMIADMKILIPTVEEQINILKFLENYDSQLNYIEIQIEKYKNIKQALLQKMFV